MIKPVRTTPPTNAVVSLAEIKAHCRIESDENEHDALLEGFVQGATDYLDGWSGILGRCMISQTWRQDFRCWQTCMRLPFPDVQSVTVKYFDEDDVETTVASSLYELLEDTRGSYVKFLGSFSRPSLTDQRDAPISITFVAGYGAEAAAVPKSLRIATQMLAGHWFLHREAVATGDVIPAPLSFASLTNPYRRHRI